MKNYYILLSLFFTSTLFAQDLNLEWVKSVQGNSFNDGESIYRDDDGNTVSTGIFQLTADFDPGPNEFNLSSNGYIDVFVQKLDNEGDFVWAKSIGGASWDRGISVACDSEGDIYIGGTFNGTVDFDPGPSEYNLTSIGQNNVFILKLDANGDLVWAKSINNGSEPQAYGPIIHSLEIDLNDNVYLSGNFNDTVDFDPGVDIYLLESSGLQDAYVMKLTSDGDFEWANSISGIQSEKAFSLAFDDLENVFVTGNFNGTTDFDPSDETVELSSVGAYDMFIEKFDSNGNFEWVKRIEGNFWNQENSLDLDDAGNIYIGGGFSGTVDFDPGEETFFVETGVDSSWSYFFLKLNSEGEFDWANFIGDDFNIQNSIFSVDGDGFIYATGSFWGTEDFDPNEGIYELTSPGAGVGRDLYLLKLDQNGVFIWAKAFASSFVIDVKDIECYDNGNIYLIGFFNGIVDFDPSDDVQFVDGAGMYNLRFSQDSCANLGISITEVIDVSCIENGLATTVAVNGNAPYSYHWNTEPASTEANASFENSGNYTLTVTDSLNCTREVTLVISGPNSTIDFDLNANMIEAGFRPGFNDVINLDGFNSGCAFVDGEMKFVLDELVIYDSSTVVPDLILGDTLIWNFSDFNYDEAHILSQLYVTTSELAEIGDTVCFDLIITPIDGDADESNNIKEYCFPVVNGFDPNNKQVYPQGVCDENYTLMGDFLSYTIQFQNTGNAEAINVHIIDSLSANLDVSTISIISKSHEMYTEILEGNVLNFKFDNIYLPDSSSNEVESHGYVTFEIKHNSDLANETTISNKSEIYFDYNQAIITNTVQNTFVDILPMCSEITAINENHEGDGIRIYPNPNQGKISIELGDSKDVNIKVYSLNGQVIYASTNSAAALHQIDLEGPAGIYVLEISIDSEMHYYKLIKE